jgi:hypothetical protein
MFGMISLKPYCCRERIFLFLKPNEVLAGLVPAIHAVPGAQSSEIAHRGTAWMAGTSPAKTRRGPTYVTKVAIAIRNRPTRIGSPHE